MANNTPQGAGEINAIPVSAATPPASTPTPEIQPPTWGELDDNKADGTPKVPTAHLTPAGGSSYRDRAGIELCKILLYIVSAVIGLVLIITWISDVLNTFRSREAQEQVVRSISGLRADALTPVKLAAATTSLERIRGLAKQPQFEQKVAQADVQHVVSVLNELASTEGDPARNAYWKEEQARFTNLQVTPKNISNFPESIFDTLTAQLKSKQGTLPAEGMEQQRLVAARDLLKDIEVARESERKHTLALTQLILINVLLPLLTAMFGYIFGVNQARENNSGI